MIGTDTGPAGPALRTATGARVALPVERWMGTATAVELDVLGRAVGPVLDVGCGPGRHVMALAHRGVTAMGVDVSPHAVALARLRGAPVLERSVFDRLPGTRRWGSALLFDGNIGIGGDPVALLRRLAVLLHPDGRVLAELDPPGAPWRRETVRLEVDGGGGPWFPWAWVPADAAEGVAEAAGMRVVERWAADGRWFSRFDPA